MHKRTIVQLLFFSENHGYLQKEIVNVPYLGLKSILRCLPRPQLLKWLKNLVGRSVRMISLKLAMNHQGYQINDGLIL